MLFGRKKEPEKSFEERLENFIETEIAASGAPENDEHLVLSSSLSNPASDEEAPDAAGQTAALAQEASPAQAMTPVLRALFEGAYLSGDLEIKRVLSRGPVNYYLADGGHWDEPDFKLVAERAAPAQPVLSLPVSPLFPPAARFVQDGREYAVFDYLPPRFFRDWRAAPNDAAFLGALRQFAVAFAALDDSGLTPFAPLESLLTGENGEILFCGFVDAEKANAEMASGLEQTSPNLALLCALSSKIARENLAARATLRLDDEFGALALAVETKAFAQALVSNQFKNCAQVLIALELLEAPDGFETALRVDVGRERELNEDSGLVLRWQRAGHIGSGALDLLAVADGMGGHEGGEIASQKTLDALQTAILSRALINWNDNALLLRNLQDVALEVNAAVVAMNENPPFAAAKNKPGSTLCCALRVQNRLFIVNAGDSRAYRWSARTGLTRLSKDHSFVQDLIDAGRLSPEDAWNHPDGNVILSHIGMPRGLIFDVVLHLLQRGDRIVLVSDGVVDTLRETEIEAVIAAAQSPDALAESLVAGANAGGGTDNIAVAVLWAK